MATLNPNETQNVLYKLVKNGEFVAAVILTQRIDKEQVDAIVTYVVDKLLHPADSTVDVKLLSYAYKLGSSGALDVVERNFPTPIKLIVGQQNVSIVNVGYPQALKLDAHTDGYGDRVAWGDSRDKTSKNVHWRFEPVWSNNEVTFRLYNIQHGMYLKLGVGVDSIGDRQAWGTTDSKSHSIGYSLQPYLINTNMVFSIINREYSQVLKLVGNADSYGDRLLMGHNGDIHEDVQRFRWTIASASS